MLKKKAYKGKEPLYRVAARRTMQRMQEAELEDSVAREELQVYLEDDSDRFVALLDETVDEYVNTIVGDEAWDPLSEKEQREIITKHIQGMLPDATVGDLEEDEGTRLSLRVVDIIAHLSVDVYTQDELDDALEDIQYSLENIHNSSEVEVEVSNNPFGGETEW